MVPQDDLRDFDGVGRLFPLRGVVHFPHVLLPLHIFEPRYRQMTEHALASDQRIVIIQPRPSLETSYPDRPPLHQVGCLGRIVRHERLPDGRFNFLLLGVRRIRIARELAVGTLYRQAEIELIDEPRPGPDAALLALQLSREFERLRPLDPEWQAVLYGKVPLSVLTDLVAHALPIPAESKQALLEQPDPSRRASALIESIEPVNPIDASLHHGDHRPPPSFSQN
jgi:Lon protease-like protein